MGGDLLGDALQLLADLVAAVHGSLDPGEPAVEVGGGFRLLVKQGDKRVVSGLASHGCYSCGAVGAASIHFRTGAHFAMNCCTSRAVNSASQSQHVNVCMSSRCRRTVASAWPHC